MSRLYRVCVCTECLMQTDVSRGEQDALIIIKGAQRKPFSSELQTPEVGIHVCMCGAKGKARVCAEVRGVQRAHGDRSAIDGLGARA